MADVLAADDAARLTDFARAFKAAARAVVLYPGTHPAIASSLGRLAQLTAPPQLTAPLTIRVTADNLLVGGLGAARVDLAVRELAAMLHAHQIGEVTVQVGADLQAWHQFLLLLGRAPDAVRAEGGIARLWTTMAGHHIDIREIDYAEVLRERTSGAAASWQQVVASCLTGQAFEIPEELLAALINGSTDSDVLADVFAQLEQADDTEATVADRAAALVRLLRGIINGVRARAPHRSEAVLRELAMAFGRLSPDMLLAVLEHADEDAARAAAVSAVVSRMPDGTIASFVATQALQPSAPIDRVAQAFQALVVDPERRERLVTMAYDTAVVSGAEGEDFDRNWQDIAGRLLSQYSDEPFVSNHYARELSTVRLHAVEVDQLREDPPDRLAAWLGTVATTELRKLDLQLVLDLLRIEEEPGQRDMLGLPLVSLLDDLLLVGDFDAADRIVDALRTDATRGNSEARQVFAAATLARMVSESTMRHVLGHLATVDDAHVGRMKAVCLGLGEALVRPLAEALAVEERSRTRERLTEFLLAFGAVGRREVEQLKASANPAVRRTAIYLLREFGGSEALPDLAELLDDAEPAVQREAVRAILTIGTEGGYRVLEQALGTGTARSREAIMQALGSPRDERAAPLLVYILEHVSHRGPLAWVYARALDLLGQLHDPQSVPALRDALYRGEWWAPGRTASLRHAAAAALARIGTAESIAALSDAASHGPRSTRAAARAQLEQMTRGRVTGGAR